MDSWSFQIKINIGKINGKENPNTNNLLVYNIYCTIINYNFGLSEFERHIKMCPLLSNKYFKVWKARKFFFLYTHTVPIDLLFMFLKMLLLFYIILFKA